MRRVLARRERFIAGVCAVALFGLAAAATSAWAIATVPTVWSGQATGDATWSNDGNWGGGTHPTGGALSFPHLQSCSSPHVCYSSNNDLMSATFSGITVDDGSGYGFTGNSFTLGGATGITASAGTRSFLNTVSFAMDITLGADQVWNIDGGGNSQGIALDGQVGGAHTLGIGLVNGGTLSTSQDVEIGNVTISGSGGGSGLNAGNNGIVRLSGGGLNGTDGNSVALTDAALIISGNVSVGHLSSTGGDLQITSGILTADGDVTLDDSSVAEFTVGGGTTPGTDYGQLDVGAHNVTPGGSLQLLVRRDDSGCATLNVGNAYTLVTTTGLLNDFTFSNAPDGAVLTTPAGACPRSQLRINYSPGSSGSVTATVVDDEPHSTSLPTISGIQADGQTLTEHHATWGSGGGSAPSSYHYTWSRCDRFGNNCTSVGSDSQSYTLRSTDVGHSMRVAETAVNGVGASRPVTSAPTNPIGALTPYNQVVPVISGDPAAGQSLHASTGTWSGTLPMSYSYQWWRCRGLFSCAPVAGGPDYQLTAADVGASIHVVVTATNVANPPSSSAHSSAVGPVRASSEEIAGLLASGLVPHGRADSIKAILHAGGAVISQTALEPGLEQVSWYYLPPGAHIAGRHPKPVLIAGGRVTFASDGTARLKLKLTRAGRRMLRHARHLKLTAKGTFTPTGGTGVSAQRSFKLKR